MEESLFYIFSQQRSTFFIVHEFNQISSCFPYYLVPVPKRKVPVKERHCTMKVRLEVGYYVRGNYSNIGLQKMNWNSVDTFLEKKVQTRTLSNSSQDWHLVLAVFDLVLPDLILCSHYRNLAGRRWHFVTKSTENISRLLNHIKHTWVLACCGADFAEIQTSSISFP